MRVLDGGAAFVRNDEEDGRDDIKTLQRQNSL